MSKILLLGAGASHENGVDNIINPPLAKGFFEECIYSILKEHYHKLYKFLNEIIGKSLYKNKNIEELLALLEPICQLGLNKSIKENFNVISPLDIIRYYILDIIYITTKWLLEKESPYYKKLVTDFLVEEDYIINFNYDLILETSLLKNTSWKEQNGYGWESEKKIGRRKENDDTIKSLEKISNFEILKPHGSINFYRNIPVYESEKDEKEKNNKKHKSISIKSVKDFWKDYIPFGAIDFENSTDEKYIDDWVKNVFEDIYVEYGSICNSGINFPLIIIPTPYKSLNDLGFAEMKIIWNKVYYAIENADEIFSIGFSFSDVHFNNILFDAIKNRNIDIKINIVTNSYDSFKNIQEKIDTKGIKINSYIEGFGNFIKEL